MDTAIKINKALFVELHLMAPYWPALSLCTIYNVEFNNSITTELENTRSRPQAWKSIHSLRHFSSRNVKYSSVSVVRICCFSVLCENTLNIFRFLKVCQTKQEIWWCHCAIQELQWAWPRLSDRPQTRQMIDWLKKTWQLWKQTFWHRDIGQQLKWSLFSGGIKC